LKNMGRTLVSQRALENLPCDLDIRED